MILFAPHAPGSLSVASASRMELINHAHHNQQLQANAGFDS